MRQTELTILELEQALFVATPNMLQVPFCLLVNEAGEIGLAGGTDAGKAEELLARLLDDDSHDIHVKYPVYMWARKIVSEKIRNWKPGEPTTDASVLDLLDSPELVEIRASPLYIALNNFEERESNQGLLRDICEQETATRDHSQLN